ncbi:hypothetical protein HD554DRAFT_2037721 [Boletus coccyginus]|nr:hypothetical protein HD554DRAFT_2037721 [Boletus coccyginus]
MGNLERSGMFNTKEWEKAMVIITDNETIKTTPRRYLEDTTCDIPQAQGGRLSTVNHREKRSKDTSQCQILGSEKIPNLVIGSNCHWHKPWTVEKIQRYPPVFNTKEWGELQLGDQE